MHTKSKWCDLLIVFVTFFFLNKSCPFLPQLLYYVRTVLWPIDSDHPALLLQGSSDEFIDANIQLALVVARKLKELRGTRSCIVSSSFIHRHWDRYAVQVQDRAHLLTSSWFQVFPDQPEKRRASQIFRTAIDTVNSASWNNIFIWGWKIFFFLCPFLNLCNELAYSSMTTALLVHSKTKVNCSAFCFHYL